MAYRRCRLAPTKWRNRKERSECWPGRRDCPSGENMPRESSLATLNLNRRLQDPSFEGLPRKHLDLRQRRRSTVEKQDAPHTGCVVRIGGQVLTWGALRRRTDTLDQPDGSKTLRVDEILHQGPGGLGHVGVDLGRRRCRRTASEPA